MTIKLEHYRDPAFVNICTQALEEFVLNTGGVKNVLLATVDGFSIANCQVEERGDGLAAVGSSIFALGATLGSEFQLGECKSITVENELGRVHLLTVHEEEKQVILLIQCLQHSTLAMVLHGAQKLAAELREALAQMG